jgi:hypothetical protein
MFFGLAFIAIILALHHDNTRQRILICAAFVMLATMRTVAFGLLIVPRFTGRRD